MPLFFEHNRKDISSAFRSGWTILPATRRLSDRNLAVSLRKNPGGGSTRNRSHNDGLGMPRIDYIDAKLL